MLVFANTPTGYEGGCAGTRDHPPSSMMRMENEEEEEEEEVYPEEVNQDQHDT
jgi:hypothetical protein